jgi:hypothetical protein
VLSFLKAQRIPVIDILWDLPDDPNGNVWHIAEHGLVPVDVEFVINNPIKRGKSRSSGRPMVLGLAPCGERIVVIYEQIDELRLYPIAAYIVQG